MNAIIEKGLKHSFSYAEYRNLVSELVEQGKSTGADQSEAMANYTKLNAQRMNRLDKTISVVEELKEELEKQGKKYTWLIISESWCADANQTIPVLNKVAEAYSNIDFRIVLRDDNPELMDAYLTNGARAIPKLIMLDEQGEEVGVWGARPKGAAKLIADYKAEHGVVDAPAKEALLKWYNADKGESVQKEILEMLKK